MLDIKLIREKPEFVKEALQRRGIVLDFEQILFLDTKRRRVLKKIEEIRAQKNKNSKEIIKIKEKKEKEGLILKMKELDKEEESLKKELRGLEDKINGLIFQLPNIPFSEVPIGKDDSENIVLREVNEKPVFDFKPLDYLEIAEKLDLIDIKRASKTSGSRFGFLKREAVLLEFAIINFTLDILIKEGFIPVLPPVLIKPELFKGMGYLEKGKDEVYYLEKDNLYLIGTAEQIIGPMHADEIFEEEELPKRYVGFSSCFRREAGSYGKDTKGIFRVHQFDKIEMFSFCKPEDSRKEHQFFLSLQERLVSLLNLPFRVVQICTGDMGFPAAEQFDIETWIPSEGRYRETHSTSNCTDFQSRRLNIRYRQRNRKLNFVHTINGTAFALGRIIIAIIENYQQKDGSIRIPKVLQKYLSFERIKR